MIPIMRPPIFWLPDPLTVPGLHNAAHIFLVTLARSLFLDCVLSIQTVEYARQLSVFMVQHNRTKLKRQDSSKLFALHAKTTMDVFFDSEPLAKAARLLMKIDQRNPKLNTNNGSRPTDYYEPTLGQITPSPVCTTSSKLST